MPLADADVETRSGREEEKHPIHRAAPKPIMRPTIHRCIIRLWLGRRNMSTLHIFYSTESDEANVNENIQVNRDILAL